MFTLNFKMNNNRNGDTNRIETDSIDVSKKHLIETLYLNGTIENCRQIQSR